MELGILVGMFGLVARSFYRKTQVKNSELLELLIYGIYTEEQSKIEKQEQEILYEDANYYYQEGQKEVNKTLKKKKAISTLDMALFFTLLEKPNAKGYNWQQYIEATIKYNADQIYRQMTIDLQQQKEPDIANDIYQNIIKRQDNSRLNINNNKISGDVDLTMIGINNQAKLEGITSLDDNAKVKFISISDEKRTKMCESLDGQEFYINDWNEFSRYSKANDCIKKYRCFGLVRGLNLPPVIDGFHWCRSYIVYLPVEKQAEKEYNIANYIRKNSYTDSKILDKEIKKAIKLLPLRVRELLKDTKFYIINKNSYYDRAKDEIYLLKDANKYEILHEIGHVIETKLDILHDTKYIGIQKKGLESINPIADTTKINGYGENDFVIDTGKFVSEYQRRVYEEDIDENGILDYHTFTFNSKTLGEYFAEGFRCYYENNKRLKKKDIDLYNYIEGVLK